MKLYLLVLLQVFSLLQCSRKESNLFNNTIRFLLDTSSSETLSLSITGSLSSDGTTISNTLITTNSSSLNTSTVSRNSLSRSTSSNAMRCVDYNLNSGYLTCYFILYTSNISAASDGCFHLYYSSPENQKLESISKFQSISVGNNIAFFHEEKIPSGATGFSLFSCNASTESLLTSESLTDYTESAGVLTDSNGNYTVSLEAGKYHTLSIRRLSQDLGDLTIDLTNFTTEESLDEIKSDSSKLAISIPSGLTHSVTINGPVNSTGTSATNSGNTSTTTTVDFTTFSEEIKKDSTLAIYSIGGSISGLASSGLVLQNNGSDDLTIASGSTSFTFATLVSGAYSVTIKTQPTGYTCTVNSASGTASTNVSNVSISCQCGSLLSGTIQGCNLSLATNVTTLAGNATSGSVDGTGTSASFNSPYGITTDGTNLYIADTNSYAIRKIVISSGVVSTLAGSGSSGSADGTGTSASFATLRGITTDGTNLYVVDALNHTIRKVVISSGVVTTFAGSGSSGSIDATGTSASFNFPQGIAIHGTDLYVADSANATIRKIVISSGVVTTFAGTGSGGSTNGTGTLASFSTAVNGLVSDGINLYVADAGNDTIRKIVISTAVVSTFAGTTGVNGFTNATGTAALFDNPLGVTTDGTNLYVNDTNNNAVRKIVIASRVVTTVAGSGSAGFADATGTSALFDTIRGITTDGTNLYISDGLNHRIRKID